MGVSTIEQCSLGGVQQCGFIQIMGIFKLFDLRIDTGDSAWKAFDAKQALLDNTSCGYIHEVYNK